MSDQPLKACCSRIDDYLDGDLSDDELSVVEAALADCFSCQEIVRIERDLADKLKQGWNSLEAPPVETALLATDIPERSEPNVHSAEEFTADEIPASQTQLAKPIGDSRPGWMNFADRGMVAIGLTLMAVILGIIGLLANGISWNRGQNEQIAGQETSPLTEPGHSGKTEPSNVHNDAPKNNRKGITSDENSQKNADAPSLSIAKASVSFSNDHVGVRVDQPDEEFTLIQVYPVFQSRQ